jgi:hypothetical protein
MKPGSRAVARNDVQVQTVRQPAEVAVAALAVDAANVDLLACVPGSQHHVSRRIGELLFDAAAQEKPGRLCRQRERLLSILGGKGWRLISNITE